MTTWGSMLIRRSIASIVLVCAISVASASADPITLSINVAPTSINVHDTFDIAINIAGISDLYLFQFDLSFNDTLLDPEFVLTDPADPFGGGGFSGEGAFLPTGGATFFVAGSYSNSDPGTIAFTYGILLGALQGVDGAGNLATLRFKATGAGLAQFSMSNNIVLEDSLGNSIQPTEISGASVVIDNINSVNDTTTVGQLLSILLCGTGLGAIMRRRFGKISRS